MRATVGRLRLVRAAGERHGAIVLLALAALTRFPGLGGPEPGLDESWSWYFVHRVLSSDRFLEQFGLGLDGPLFSTLNVAVAQVFGLSLAGLRLPQAIFGTASVPLLLLVLRRCMPARLALYAGLLAALSPFLILHSRQARPYAQLLFFALLFTWVFYRTAPWRPSTLRRILLGACTILTVASHYYALVYLVVFYAIVLAAHAAAGRRRELRDDLATAAVGVVAASPLLLLLAHGLSRFSLGYWKWETITLPGIFAEQFLLLDSLVRPDGPWLALLVTALLLVPLVHALRRDGGLVRSHPVVALVWLAAPLLVVLTGAVLGRSLLFFARGFIACAPFLLAYWVLFTGSMRIGRWPRRIYVAVLMVPFLLASVVTSRPDQPYFRHRGVMAEIAGNVASHRAEFDLVLVHHWVLTQYFAYYLPEQVHGLGAMHRDTAARSGEMAAVLEDLDSLPDDAHLLLVLNDVALDQVDPRGEVLRRLRSERPVLRDLPCRDVVEPGDGLLCRRMLLLGAVRSTR